MQQKCWIIYFFLFVRVVSDTTAAEEEPLDIDTNVDENSKKERTKKASQLVEYITFTLHTVNSL